MVITLNSKISIGIMGYGVVGKAAANTLVKAYNIIKYDKYQNLDSFDELLATDYIFIAVPTPFDCSLNAVDHSSVIECLEKLENLNYKNIVIIKSTVEPGFCDFHSEKYNFDIIFNPEFLRESTTPNEDFENQETIVIGTNSKEKYNSVRKMYEGVLVPNANYFHTTSKEAEMIKCAQNTMLASRVALANMIFEACKSNGVDYDIIKSIAFDRFEIIGPHMTQVPGPDGNFGFGGKCLPKDIRAFSTIHKSELLS